MSNFTYKYGSYTHEVGSVVDFVWEHIPNITRRGRRDVALYRVTLRGLILCTSGDQWQDVRDKINALTDAYAGQPGAYIPTEDQKFVVLNPDGTESQYVLDPAVDTKILRGPYLANYRFPTGTIEELAVKREWEIVLECLRLEPDSQIIHYEETIDHGGTCAAAWAYQNTLLLPRQYFTWPSTTQRIIQRGRSTGLEGYYMPGYLAGQSTIGVRVLNDPYAAIPSLYERQDLRREILGKPLRYTIPRLNRTKFLYYPAEWTYVYESPTPFAWLQPV
jgi:hypothetical protein